jgi:mRNA-degrading endonuclease RelE of RelBE toxin-antitoxin system
MGSIEISPRAEKALRKLDRPVARRVRDGLIRLTSMEDRDCPGLVDTRGGSQAASAVA